MAKIDVLGAGIAGLWQALTFARRGHEVTVWDPAGFPSSIAASRLAGAMLAPYCEGEAGHEMVRELGIKAVELWLREVPGIVMAGTLVVAPPRDQADLRRFATITEGHRWLDASELARIEGALDGRFSSGLFFEAEGHLSPAHGLRTLEERATACGVVFRSEIFAGEASGGGWLVDCRGIAARDSLKKLRGVRGERIVIECPGVELSRPVRLLHPRIPFYIVPWGASRFMIGATLIESDDAGEPTLRSVLELLSAAYALLPALAEARIIDISSGVRPAFPDNHPRIVARGQRLFVNGLYRHGFLLSPILASFAADYIEEGKGRDGIVVEDHGEW